MSTFTFDLVSPERQVFSGAASQVVVPGAEGDFGVMAGHAPLVATLRPGILAIHGDGVKRFYVRGGFAEVNAAGLTVLAEQSFPVEEFDAERLATEIRNAEEDRADAQDDVMRQKAEERLSQLESVRLALATVNQYGH